MSMRSSITALSTALALAVTLSAASTPALAEKSKYEQAKPPTIVEATDKKPKVEQVKPGSIVDAGVVQQQPTFKPDVRVVYLDFDWNGNGRLYRFRVENIGIETAYDVSLSSSVGQQSDTSTATKKASGHYTPIASLATAQSQDVTVSCDPQPGFHCTGASLGAGVANDLDPSNNSAGSD